jgi:hypothetical protein
MLRNLVAPVALLGLGLAALGCSASQAPGGVTTGGVTGDACSTTSTAGWTTMPATGAPSPRQAAASFWTGNAFLVWSGIGSTGALSDGALYDPCAGTWHAMSTVGAPTPSGSALPIAPIWTGSRLVYFETAATSSSAPAAMYDLASDSWIPMASAGRPTTGPGTRQVWTGARVFTWGGSGATFDPAANVWKAAAPGGASASNAYVAALDGGEVFVWGGTTTDPATGRELSREDGAIYDTAKDSWTPVSSTGAPDVGHDAQVFFLGGRVVVWAPPFPMIPGNDASIVFRGGVYDPKTDSWAPLATQPEGTLWGRAVAAGDSLLVVGSLNTSGGPGGALFDPVANRWHTIAAPPVDGIGTSRLIAAEGRVLLESEAGQSVGAGATFALYDVAANAWQTLAPYTKRLYASVAWDGKRAIAFGGVDVEIDPNGNDGCGTPRPGPVCDPVTPTKQTQLGDGLTLVP